MSPLGFISTTVFDPANRVTASINPLLFRTSYVYDVADRRVPSSMRTTIARLRRSTLRTGRWKRRMPSDTVRRASLTNRASRWLLSTQMRIAPRLYSTQTDARRKSSTPSVATTYGFDAASRRTLRIDARGNRTSYVFDNDDHEIKRLYPDGTRSHKFTIRSPSGWFSTTRRVERVGHLTQLAESLHKPVQMECG